jgi:hypothetical protein
MLRRLFYTGPSLATLHEDYAKRGRIDEVAPITSRSTIIIDAPIERVWDVLHDLRAWPTWYPAIQMLELTTITPGMPFIWKLDGATIRSTFALVEPQRGLAWTGISFGFKAVDLHLLEPVNEGRTRVIIAESLAGPLLPLLYSSTKLRASHEKWLTTLKHFVENN